MAGPELTPDTAGNPFVEVFFDPADLATDTARIRISRYSDGRAWQVRGGFDIATGVAALDFEAPFGVESIYRAEMLTSDGRSLGYSETGTVTLDYQGTVVHQPLDPALWTTTTILEESAESLVRPTPGSVVWAQGDTVGRWRGSRRRGLVGTKVSLLTETLEAADQFQRMLGLYETQQVGVLCIRTSDVIRWPRTFFARGDWAEVDFDVALGGESVQFEATVDEVAPPFAGLASPLLTYDDLDVAFADYDARDAAFASYTDQDRAYEYAGLAG